MSMPVISEREFIAVVSRKSMATRIFPSASVNCCLCPSVLVCLYVSLCLSVSLCPSISSASLSLSLCLSVCVSLFCHFLICFVSACLFSPTHPPLPPPTALRCQYLREEGGGGWGEGSGDDQRISSVMPTLMTSNIQSVPFLVSPFVIKTTGTA